MEDIRSTINQRRVQNWVSRVPPWWLGTDARLMLVISHPIKIRVEGVSHSHPPERHLHLLTVSVEFTIIHFSSLTITNADELS